MTSHRTFALRRLHSLAGVIPLGIFLALHLFLNSVAAKGPEAYNKVITSMQSLPNLWLIEWIIILFPLWFHGIYGLWVWWTGKSNIFEYKFYRNWMFFLQRLAGIITLVFVTYHVLAVRYAGLFGEEAGFNLMKAALAQPFMFALYIVGLLAAVYHFTNGLFTFCISWGVTVGQKSQKIANISAWLLFMVMSALGINSLVSFR